MNNYDNEPGNSSIDWKAITVFIICIISFVLIVGPNLIKKNNELKQENSISFEQCKSQCTLQTGKDMWDYYPDYTFDGTKNECKRVCKDATGSNININL